MKRATLLDVGALSKVSGLVRVLLPQRGIANGRALASPVKVAARPSLVIPMVNALRTRCSIFLDSGGGIDTINVGGTGVRLPGPGPIESEPLSPPPCSRVAIGDDGGETVGQVGLDSVDTP